MVKHQSALTLPLESNVIQNKTKYNIMSKSWLIIKTVTFKLFVFYGFNFELLF